jgi:hypothetical protein
VSCSPKDSRSPFLVQRSEIVADVAVVLRGVGESLFRQVEAGGIGQRTAVGLHLGNQRRVVGRVGDDGDMAVVLGRGAHHRRTADVDVLDGVVEGVRLRHRGDEGIQVDAYQVDVAHAMLVHRRDMFGQVAARQDAAVHLGMQRLDPAVEHFRKAGVFADVDHRQTGVAQRLGGAAGGEQFDAGVGERAGEIDQAGFIRHGEQGTLNFHGSVNPRDRVRATSCAGYCD